MSATYTNKKRKIEKYLEVVRLDGLNTDQNVNIGVTGTPNLWVAGNLTVGGTTSFTSDVVTSNSANAFAVGPNGVTNPVFNIDASEASAATGIQIEGFAAGSGVAIETLSSGTNESGTWDAKGTGTLGINTVSTTSGKVTIGNSTSLAGLAVNGLVNATSASANALTVGLAGVTNPAFNVDASTASSATGLNIKSAAAAAGVALTVISSGTNESITADAKGSGTYTLNSIATGKVVIGASTGLSTQGLTVNSVNSAALAVGPGGGANPALIVDVSTASSSTGFGIKSNGNGGTLSLTTLSGQANESVTWNAKGTGTITINSAVVATAGGAVADGIQYGSLSVGLYTGTGAPTFSAMNGSIYTDSNATTTTTRIYVNKSGAGTAGTTWTALTTAA